MFEDDETEESRSPKAVSTIMLVQDSELAIKIADGDKDFEIRIVYAGGYEPHLTISANQPDSAGRKGMIYDVGAWDGQLPCCC